MCVVVMRRGVLGAVGVGSFVAAVGLGVVTW